MAYVIAEPCIGTKDNSCVEVCPVDCIHPTPEEPGYDAAEMLYIDPEECIDCDACVEACPVGACFAEGHLPDEGQKFTQLTDEYFANAKYPGSRPRHRGGPRRERNTLVGSPARILSVRPARSVRAASRPSRKRSPRAPS